MALLTWPAPLASALGHGQGQGGRGVPCPAGRAVALVESRPGARHSTVQLRARAWVGGPPGALLHPFPVAVAGPADFSQSACLVSGKFWI